MTHKLADRLKYNAATLAAISKWLEIGEKKPRRVYAKEKVKRGASDGPRPR
jgi:hypothetical protein